MIFGNPPTPDLYMKTARAIDRRDRLRDELVDAAKTLKTLEQAYSEACMEAYVLDDELRFGRKYAA